jgi:amino acid adenylation domain-containing protein
MTLLGDLVAAQAAARPGAIAVRQWDETLTYGELVDAAARLANVLRRHGVSPETRVGVCARRRPQVLVGLLGVLFAGGAYVPLDPDHPPTRRDLVLADAGITVVVVDDAGAAALAGSGLRLVPACGAGGQPTLFVRPAAPDNAAYVLYTSGSTGRPKGVTVSHRNAVAFATSTARAFELDENCRSIGFAALGFDVSILDIFAPLSRGGSVAFIPETDRVDPVRLQRFLEAHEVTWGCLPPALLPLLEPDRLPDLRHAITAGEPPGPEQVARWSAPPRRRFFNWYGPTETTVCVVGTELTGGWDRPLPIGHPLAGCRAYVLDESLRPCPPGVPGELHIGGSQVARGYLGRPALTADRFVPDPFGDVPGARLYRTGDRVTWNPEHGLEFLGRLDRQVKIAGQRVELGEVESVLRLHVDVLQAVADTRPGPAGQPELVAYLTPATAPDLSAVRAHCADRLPAYMIPTRVVRLGALPLNSSGKVDLAALRATAPPRVSAAPRGNGATRRSADPPTRPPATPIHAAVLEAWRGAFGTADAGPDDDFFFCGGHSLLAMRLVAALRGRLRRAVTVEDVLAGRTPAGIAARVERLDEHGDVPVRTGQPPALSPAQRRVWFVDRLAATTPAYNIAFAERLRGPLDVPALAAALRAVADRHDVLRWRLPATGGQPRAVVDPPAPVPLPVEELRVPDPERLLRERLASEASERFDLAEGPLWRVRLFRLAEREHVLAVTVHHTVFDGWSQELFQRDLSRAYAAAQAGRTPDLGAPPATYADYVGWLSERHRRHGTDVRWWVDHLTGAPTVLDLPRDSARPPMQTFHGSRASATVSAEPAAEVRRLAAARGTTPYAVLLAAFAQLLRRQTGQHDLVVGAPVADRRHPAFDDMIGFCVDTVPLRLRVRDDLSFAAHVDACRDELVATLARADTPLDRIVAALAVHRDLSRNPLIQVLFNMYNFAEAGLALPGVTAEALEAGLPGSLFDLTLYVSERGDGYALQAVYNADLYRPERVEALLASYVHLLGDLVARPDRRPVVAATLRSASPTALPDPAAPLPSWHGSGVVERIQHVARRRPDAPAVAGAGGRLTYRQLEDARRATTAAIRAAGIGSGDTVAVLATRDVRLPVLLLGVLASGARWAILDPELPPARLAAQARAAGCRAALVGPGAEHALAALPGLRLCSPNGGGGLDELAPPDARGYAAFTSGSTGDARAVFTAERPLAHFLDWYVRTFALRDDDQFAALAGLAHDPLLRDVFAPLVVGARLHVPAAESLRDPARLAGWLDSEGVTVLHLTPQLARLLCGTRGTVLPSVRLVALAGDQLRWSDVDTLRRLVPAARVVNFYGTTETPQAQAWHEPARAGVAAGAGTRPVPVGHGIDGAQLLVIGPGGRPAAIGELGEVTVRSHHLATGYATDGRLDEELTRARFSGEGDDRMFRTGDLGRHEPDGTVVIAGRADDQVKVRGFRVELGEVEAALLAYPGVHQAAVVADPRDGELVLHGHVATEPGVTAGAVRAHLRTVLPEYAIPSSLNLLPALPLTRNGKVDRDALPRPVQRPSSGRADEPATPTERLVAAAWQRVLGLPRVGRAENFFEVGGHSMAIVAVQAELVARLGRDVPIVDLFSHPTVATLAAHLDGSVRSPGLDRAAERVAARRARARRQHTDRTGAGDADPSTRDADRGPAARPAPEEASR